VDSVSATDIAIALAAGLSLAGYGVFILAPAWASYGRVWERLAASVLTLFILATLLGTGAAIGFAIVWSYDRFA
jgi:transketolase C-terminal domain/subunit